MQKLEVEISGCLKVIIGKLHVICWLCLFLCLNSFLGTYRAVGRKCFGFEDTEGLYVVYQSCYIFLKYFIKKNF